MSYGRKIVSKANILELINDYDIFQYYCKGFQTVNSKFSSEFRKDKDPSAVIGRWGEKLYYKDFAEPESYDCISYIQRKYNVTFGAALNLISRDFNLELSGTIPNSKLPISNPIPGVSHNVDITQFSVAPTVIKIKARKWQKKDGDFWKKRFGITLASLRKFKIVPITNYWYSGKKGHSMTTTQYHAYAFFCGHLEDGRESWKIYQPYSTTIKWMSNVPGKYLQGFDNLPSTGELLIITKSLKDVITLYQLGYSATAPHGETFPIEEEMMDELRSRFTKVVLLYDNDKAGKKAAALLSSLHSIECIFMPEGTKDASDFVECYDYPALNEVLQQLLKDGEERMESRDT
jgi:hypothetical protein|tara:strand:- start:1 stop:1041 length:1041 start_codon:yes stop_codon:yes gene_type:complete